MKTLENRLAWLMKQLGELTDLNRRGPGAAFDAKFTYESVPFEFLPPERAE